MTTRILKQPLSRNSKTLLRGLFKRDLNLPKNASEKKLAYEMGMTPKHMYQYMAETYNKVALFQNTVIKKERNVVTMYKRQVTGFIKNTKKPLVIDLKTGLNANKKIQLMVDIISKKVGGQMIKIGIGDTYYVVNDITKMRLLEYINNNFVNTVETTGSDVNVMVQLQGAENIELSEFIPTNKYKKPKGAFFKYNITKDLELTRYGIFRENTGDYNDCCFLYALKMGGLKDEVANAMRQQLKARYTPISSIKGLCAKFKININVKQLNQSNIRHNYGKEFKERYTLGLIDEHYFLIEDTDYCSFAIKNYEEVYGRDRWNHIIKRDKNNFKIDKRRVIDSFALIKLLLENKEFFLTEISSENTFIHGTQYYNKINKDITNLHYHEEYGVSHKYVKPPKRKGFKKVMPTNIFFDFETTTYNNNNEHKPYLCRFIDDKGHKMVFYGDSCGLIMLSYLSKRYESICLIAHNMSYDVRFLIKYFKFVSKMIQKGSKVISCSGKFDEMKITMKDSYLMITMALRDFPKSFSIKGAVKEVISYNMYNNSNCLERGMIPIDEALLYIRNEHKDENQFLENITKWGIKKGDMYDCIEYSNRYCELDCHILKEGYNKFNEFMNRDLQLDINNFLTIASLSHAYIMNSGSYDGVFQLSGVPQKFIQKCVVGGRTMVRNNTRVAKECQTQALDAKSLYPSAMNRMEGFLLGLPKVIEDLDYDKIKSCDGYFIEIRIKTVGIKRQFSLISAIDENGVRQFSNDMVGKTIFVDKYSCEDMIEFQDVTFDVIRGYTFNNGRNTKINETIQHLYNERLKRKAVDDESEIVFKLCMNSSYGKSIMKDIEDDVKVFTDADEYNTYLSTNYNWIKEYTHVKDSNKFIAKMFKPTNDHFNIAHVGVEILSMSKRIMNEVMCLAEDNNMDIYYQDTDSMSMRDADIEKMTRLFKEKYGRVLVGEQMGQFGYDLKLKDDDGNKCKNVTGVRSLFIAKKVYIVELEGNKKNGDKHKGYYIRMKGIPNSSIMYECKKRGLTPFELYQKLYDGEKIGFDLTENGDKANFKYHSDFSVSTIQSGLYTRNVSFPVE